MVEKERGLKFVDIQHLQIKPLLWKKLQMAV